MRFPSVFVNHGGGPLPLMGQQPHLAANMKEIVHKFLPKAEPKAIVVVSAHWESNPIKIASSASPQMYFDYGGFPPHTYEYEYPAPGSPELAQKIHNLLQDEGLESQLDDKRGYDHGVFVPLMIMFPEANIPVVCVSLHSSLDPVKNIQIGKALSPLRDEGVLILGSGLTFHNMHAFFNSSNRSVQASKDFNGWLKTTIMENSSEHYMEALKKWAEAPGGRISHPREEHLLPLLVIAAAGGMDATPTVVYDTTNDEPGQNTGGSHAVTGFMFQ